MSNILLARTGSVLFVLWGLLHIVGGFVILRDGYAAYGGVSGDYPPLAGAILSYLAYTFVWSGAAVTVIGGTLNWRNSNLGLGLNTALIGLTDLGLVLFLVMPGFVNWQEAAPGLVLFAGALASATPACRQTHA
jgi:hypothetical protein